MVHAACAIHIIISGTVQGINFRHYAKQEAEKLGVSGWVKNRQDGSVELLAEGSEKALGELLAWCSHGPDGAEVKEIEYQWLDEKFGFSGFWIERGL